MFCRTCWANVPDGTAVCPNCQADPARVPAAPPPTVRAAPRPATAPSSDRQNRLIVLVALLVLTLIAGPPVAERLMERWRSEPAGTAALTPRAQPGLDTQAPGLEPTAPSAADPARGLLQEAYGLYREGRVLEACERYQTAANRSGRAEARQALGSCFARLGRDALNAGAVGQAVEHYRRAVDGYPEAGAAWMGLALAHIRARNLAQAEGVLQQAVARFPDDAETLYLLAEVHERQGRARESGELLRRLLARDPGHARGRALLAAVEREQKVEGGYWSQESRHFVVRYDGAGGIDVGRSVVDALEDAYDSIGRALGGYPADRLQVSIYAEDVLADVSQVPAHYIRGLYDGKKIRLNLSKSVAQSNDLTQLVRHEYTHVVIHQLSRGRAPIWVHEGLAQVMEGRRPYPLHASVPREHLTLTGIERLARTMDPVAFSAGYALTHYAMEYVVDRGGMGRLPDFLGRLGQGESTDDALRHAFGFGAEDVESRLLAVAGRS